MKNALLIFSRLFVGLLFIFSGLIKANDPVGFAIKLEEYYEIFASGGGLLSIFNSGIILHTVVFQAAFICVLEVALGIMLLLGMWSRFTSWMLLLMIIFFTILTGYSAVTGKVTDCGCFGDAIPLTPWQSFYKDIILFIFILIIFAGRRSINRLLPSVLSFILFFASVAFTVWVANTAIRYDVFIDFRPYKAGNNISELMAIPDDATPPIVEMQYIYRNKNNNEESVVGIRSDENDFSKLTPYADAEVWEFVERKDKVIDQGFIPDISDFAVIDEYESDITSEILAFEDYMLMIVSPGLKTTESECWNKINQLQTAAEEEGIFTFALVASSREEIEIFRHNHQSAFPFYQGDQKVCLAIARTNPAVVLMKQGTVIAKWPWREIPSFDALKSEYFPERPSGPVMFGNTAEAELFVKSDPASLKLAGGIEPYNEFFMIDGEGVDMASSIITDSGRVHIIAINSLAELTSSDYSAIEPVLLLLKENGEQYYFISSSSRTLLAEMSQVTGLKFDHFETDGEVLDKIFETNTGYLLIEDGKVIEKYSGTDWPVTSE